MQGSAQPPSAALPQQSGGRNRPVAEDWHKVTTARHRSFMLCLLIRHVLGQVKPSTADQQHGQTCLRPRTECLGGRSGLRAPAVIKSAHTKSVPFMDRLSIGRYQI